MTTGRIDEGLCTMCGFPLLYPFNEFRMCSACTQRIKKVQYEVKMKVPIMHGTIPHEQLAKEGAAKVMIKPAAHGAGVIAGGSMRAVLESAGITDILAKSLGSANPHNVVKATIKALGLLREPVQVAKTRNIKLSKVFNG